MTTTKERPQAVCGATCGNKKNKNNNQNQLSNPAYLCQVGLTGHIATVDLPDEVEAAGVTLTKQGSHYSGLCPHACNRHTQKIKGPKDLEKFGRFYHRLAVAEYQHQWLCEASDKELYGLFQEGGFYG